MNHKLILDGGMGQALLKRGMRPNGSLWSASALIDESQHNIVEETHLDFINAGCGAIITNNFTVSSVPLIIRRIIMQPFSGSHNLKNQEKKF